MPTPDFSSEVHLVSTCGPVREENQDAGAAWLGDADEAVLLVADGMGGHAGGREAAEIVVRSCRAALQRCTREAADWKSLLRSAIAEAQTAVRVAAASAQGKGPARPVSSGMGATLALAVVSERSSRPCLHVAHVGDVRVYLHRGRSLYRLTTDHSLVTALVRDGLLSEADAFGHPDANVVQRAVGQAGPLEAEVQQPLDLDAADTVLICSDGLHGTLRDEEIAAVLAGGVPSARAACEELLDAALAAHSQDNVTIGCARVMAARSRRRPTRI